MASPSPLIHVILAVCFVACAAPAKSSAVTALPNHPTTAPGPGVAAPTPVEPSQGLALKPAAFFFELDSSSLTAESREQLAQMAEALRKHPRVRIHVSGHTCELGTTEYNLALGQRRANAVRDYLLTLGVEGTRLEVVSYGEERPSADGHDETAWKKNRRSELAFTDPEPLGATWR